MRAHSGVESTTFCFQHAVAHSFVGLLNLFDYPGTVPRCRGVQRRVRTKYETRLCCLIHHVGIDLLPLEPLTSYLSESSPVELPLPWENRVRTDRITGLQSIGSSVFQTKRRAQCGNDDTRVTKYPGVLGV